MTIAYTITPSSVNLLLHGRMRTLNSTHPNFSAVREALKNYGLYGASPELEARIADLVDIPQFIAKVTAGRVKVGDNAVYFDDKEVHGVIAKRLLGMLGQGFNISPLARFLDRLMSNPIPTAADELYLWMEQSELPLTDDGCFLAFKKVKDDYKSYHDGQTDNSIGSKLPLLSEDRYDTDRRRTCSSGYHFCSFNYLHSYYGDKGRVVICKIAPEDVVAIPHGYNNAKGRAKTYEIIGEVPENEAQQFFVGKAVVNGFGTYQGEKEIVGLAEWEVDVVLGGVDVAMPNGALHVLDRSDDEDYCCGDDGDSYAWGDDDEVAIEPELPLEEPIAFTTSDGRVIDGYEIIKIVEAHGQRGASRLMNVARTTLQDWLTKLGARS